MRGFANTLQSECRPIQVTRIEKNLYQELKSREGFLGRIAQVYQTGFDLFKEEGRKIVHFRSEKWLHSPFGATLGQPIHEWTREASLKEGDLVWKTGQLLFRKSGHRWVIELKACEIVDLKRVLFLLPPTREMMLLWVRRLVEEIIRSGKFEGISGICHLLYHEWPGIFPEFPASISFWSRHALPQARRLIEVVLNEDLGQFEKVWERLLGLGPGLTPAGDDFLVGFLASHKLFSSSFARKLDEDSLKKSLREKAESKTNRISFQFLCDALEGIFSEILYFAFDSVLSPEYQEILEGRNEEGIGYFLRWGHSSGADTLTGVVFGLWSMIPRSGQLKNSDRDGRAFEVQ